MSPCSKFIFWSFVVVVVFFVSYEGVRLPPRSRPCSSQVLSQGPRPGPVRPYPTRRIQISYPADLPRAVRIWPDLAELDRSRGTADSRGMCVYRLAD